MGPVADIASLKTQPVGDLPDEVDAARPRRLAGDLVDVHGAAADHAGVVGDAVAGLEDQLADFRLIRYGGRLCWHVETIGFVSACRQPRPTKFPMGRCWRELGKLLENGW